MVTSTQLTGHPAGHVAISFANDMLGLAQPVRVTLGGFEHPGEVIVARQWQGDFGSPLTGVSMFRLVLLHATDAPAPTDILDDRICVAAPRGRGGRVAESKATYHVDSTEHGSSGRSRHGPNLKAADFRSLKEVRRSYISSNDPGLGRLASALATYESRVNASVAADLHEMWKSGVVVTSHDRTKSGGQKQAGREIQPGELFLLDDPESWIESAAAVLGRGIDSSITGDRVSPEQIYNELQDGRLTSAREHLRQICGIRFDEPTPVDRIDACLGGAEDEVLGDELIQLLVHELRYPPAVASLWLVMHALDRGSELVLSPVGCKGNADAEGAVAGRQHFSVDTISEFEYDADLIMHTVNLRAEKSDAWDAVLPFLKLVAPQANFTTFGGGRDSDVAEFDRQLITLKGRVEQTTPMMFRLEIATGATDRPLTRDVNRLDKVLSAVSWSHFVAASRVVFGSVAALRAALADAADQWAAVEYAADIEQTVYYLDQVEFGRVDHALAIEHRVLRSRFDLRALIGSPQRWGALQDEFSRWRQGYRKAYLEDHSLRYERDRVLRDQIEETTRRVLQIERFERIVVLRDGQGEDADVELNSGSPDDLSDRWDRVAGQFRVCDRDGSDIPLINEPACRECHGRLGQAINYTDTFELMSEVGRAFSDYCDRLSTVVSGIVLDSENSDQLQKLFRLNSAGDLSDLANVLDDKVISFLNELFGNASGNLDDWTLPHS